MPFPIGNTTAHTQKHRNYKNLKHVIQSMYGCMCINQYMLDIFGVPQGSANAFHMHMHMFWKIHKTQNHKFSRLHKSLNFIKNLIMYPNPLGWGVKMFKKRAFLSPKNKSWPQARQFCKKGAFLYKSQILLCLCVWCAFAMGLW